MSYPMIRKNRLGDWWDDFSTGLSKILEPLANAAPKIATAIAISKNKYTPTGGISTLPGIRTQPVGTTGTGTGQPGVYMDPYGNWSSYNPYGQMFPMTPTKSSPDWLIPAAIGGGALLLLVMTRKK